MLHSAFRTQHMRLTVLLLAVAACCSTCSARTCSTAIKPVYLAGFAAYDAPSTADGDYIGPQHSIHTPLTQYAPAAAASVHAAVGDALWAGFMRRAAARRTSGSKQDKMDIRVAAAEATAAVAGHTLPVQQHYVSSHHHTVHAGSGTGSSSASTPPSTAAAAAVHKSTISVYWQRLRGSISVGFFQQQQQHQQQQQQQQQSVFPSRQLLQPRPPDVTIEELLAGIEVSQDGAGGVRVALPPLPPPNSNRNSNNSTGAAGEQNQLPPVVVNLKISDLFPSEPQGKRRLLSTTQQPAAASNSGSSSTGAESDLSTYMQRNPTIAPALQQLTGQTNPSLSSSSSATSLKLCDLFDASATRCSQGGRKLLLQHLLMHRVLPLTVATGQQLAQHAGLAFGYHSTLQQLQQQQQQQQQQLQEGNWMLQLVRFLPPQTSVAALGWWLRWCPGPNAGHSSSSSNPMLPQAAAAAVGAQALPRTPARAHAAATLVPAAAATHWWMEPLAAAAAAHRVLLQGNSQAAGLARWAASADEKDRASLNAIVGADISGSSSSSNSGLTLKDVVGDGGGSGSGGGGGIGGSGGIGGIGGSRPSAQANSGNSPGHRRERRLLQSSSAMSPLSHPAAASTTSSAGRQLQQANDSAFQRWESQASSTDREGLSQLGSPQLQPATVTLADVRGQDSTSSSINPTAPVNFAGAPGTGRRALLSGVSGNSNSNSIRGSAGGLTVGRGWHRQLQQRGRGDSDNSAFERWRGQASQDVQQGLSEIGVQRLSPKTATLADVRGDEGGSSGRGSSGNGD